MDVFGLRLLRQRWMDEVAALAVALLLSLPAAAAAQGTTGTISGVALDESRAAVPVARVTATNTETGAVRSTASDRRGAFRVLDLAPGRYRVQGELAGFTPSVRGDVVVLLGQDTAVTLLLTIAPVSVRVTTEAPSSIADTRTPAAGGLVSREQIAQLPLNGRSFLQLATLQPGVIVSRATGRDFSSGFGSTQLAVAGARPEHTTYLLDGTNIADISDKAPSSVAGGLLGVDTVREFNVQTHGFAAEYGRAAGGVVSIVTQSGTNAWQRSAFWFHRDSALDSRNYFDTASIPGFRRDQFGGSVGGPLRANRFFLFASTEGLIERRSVTRTARLPDAAAHQGLLPATGGGQRSVNIHPNAAPYLKLLFPVPDGVSFGDGTAELRHAHRDPTDERMGVVKLDWQVRSGEHVMFRYSDDGAGATTSLEHPLFFNDTSSRSRFLTAQHQRVFGASALNSLRIAVNRTAREDDVLSRVEIPSSMFFTSDPHFGAITVIGMTLAGSTGTTPAEYRQRVFQVADTYMWSRGDHVLKTGVDWQHYAFGGTSYSRYGGEFRFRNLEEFLTLRRSATSQADRFTGNLPGTDTAREMSQHYVALFLQDDWQVRRNVSVNLGVRYDRVTTPTESEGRVAGLLRLDDLETGPLGVTPGAPFFDNPSGRSVAPRVGAAWSAGPATIIRGAYGLFYQPLTVSYYRGTTFRVFPYFAGVDLRQPAVFGPGIQPVLENASPSVIRRRSEFIAYDAKQPFVQQWHATLQRGIGAGFTAETGYLGSKGHNLPFYGDPNSVPAERAADGRKRIVPGATLRYPSWGRIRTRINDARSTSHNVIAGLRREFAGGVMLQTAYTFGRSFDTWSGGQHATADFDNGAGSATDWWDPEDEYGPSNFDVRHTLVVNGVWALPWGRSLSGFRGLVGQGWHVAGVLNLASGLPFTPFLGYDRAGDLQSDADLIQKPDQVGAVSYPRTAEMWFDPSAFALPQAGYYGNTRRNSLRGPGLKTLDLAFFKDVPVARTTVQLRVEAFNVLNRVNLGLPDAAALFNADGTRRPGAGRITTTSTPARQVQIGARLRF